TVNNLKSLSVPPRLGGTDAVWLVRWEVPAHRGPGHTFFAAMESDGGQTPAFFDGHPSAISTTHGRVLAYPPRHRLRGRARRARPSSHRRSRPRPPAAPARSCAP